MVVHNETSTGVTSRIADVRAALGDHDALLLVDTISSLASIDYRHDEWGVDVTVGGSQKGLMLPAGLSFNAVSAKALEASKTAKLPRSYWDWAPIIAANETGFWPYTSATNLLYGLREALQLLLREEGLENVFARHARHAAGDPRGRARLGPRGARARRAGALELADRGRARRLRRGAPGDPRALRHVARRGPRASWPTRSSGSATSATSTT